MDNRRVESQAIDVCQVSTCLNKIKINESTFNVPNTKTVWTMEQRTVEGNIERQKKETLSKIYDRLQQLICGDINNDKNYIWQVNFSW